MLPKLVRICSNLVDMYFPKLGLTKTVASAMEKVSPKAFSVSARSKFPKLALATLRVVPQNGHGWPVASRNKQSTGPFQGRPLSA